MTGELELSRAEHADLAACEDTIARGLKTFTEVGGALASIRDRRLYRTSHATFEDYCRDRWGLSSRHANRTIEAAKVAGILGPIGPVPANEAQARELAPLLGDPAALRETWQRAVESAAGRPTAADVAAARGGEQVPQDEDGDAFAEKCAEARRIMAGWGLAADDELCGIYAEHVLIRDAARKLLRHGNCPMPPGGWTWTRDPKARPGGRTPLSAANNRVSRERRRLAIWEILVEMEVGGFLIFCDKAGIKVGRGITFPDRLRYPLEDGDPPLPDDWTAEDEHHAALGRFYGWFYTKAELAGLAGSGSDGRA
jgi:hypothetical protein